MNRNVKQLQKKAKQCKVRRVPGSERVFEVISTSGEVYTCAVEGTTSTCTCDWRSYHRGLLCSHSLAAIQAAMDLAEPEKKVRVSLWTQFQDAKRQHKPILETPDNLFITVNRRPVPCVA